MAKRHHEIDTNLFVDTDNNTQLPRPEWMQVIVAQAALKCISFG